jgi:hypothetical protein
MKKISFDDHKTLPRCRQLKFSEMKEEVKEIATNPLDGFSSVV